jgi:hypothetical protein
MRNGRLWQSALQLSSVTDNAEGKQRGGIETRPAMGSEGAVTIGSKSGDQRHVTRWLQPTAAVLSR